MLKESFPHISKTVNAHPTVRITGDIYIGDDCKLAEGSTLTSTGRLIIGKNTEIGRNSIITSSQERMVIGENVSIGDDCTVEGDVGDGTRLGNGVTVKLGITIGENCKIVDGTTVSSDLENNSNI
ncbi:MAG: DapH/DapD/GlmU-related protein [Candidatus Kariarchaeaceae archaeon]|jgi:carbonic anhydrase/acetyltransferase-like protein (isoleucine patch superfamily)